MAKKEEIIIEGVALNVKHLQGKSQDEFTEAMNGGGYKHLWKDAENRDAIIAEAYSQINPTPATDGAASAAANDGGDAGTEVTSEAPKGRRR